MHPYKFMYLVSLRLQAASAITFGAQGFGMVMADYSFPQPRGCVTVMEGESMFILLPHVHFAMMIMM
jgi:hypothetical protein